MKTHCKYGHARTPENVEKSYNCRTCQQVRRRTHYATEQCKQHKRTPHYRHIITRCVAKQKKLEFNIPRDVYIELVAKPCYYCGTDSLGVAQGTGLDRIDNTKGYVLGNVLPCCGDCNKHRSNTWTVEEAKVAIQAVQDWRRTFNLEVV